MKEAYLQAKRDLFAFKMSAKQLPQRFYTVLRSERGVGGGIYQGFVTDGDEHDELENLNADPRNKEEETYRCRVAAEVRRVFLVKSG